MGSEPPLGYTCTTCYALPTSSCAAEACSTPTQSIDTCCGRAPRPRSSPRSCRHSGFILRNQTWSSAKATMNCSTHAQPQQSRGIFFEARQFITARYKHGNEERKARRDLLCVLPVQGVATSSEDESVESLNQPPEKSVDTSSLESIVRSAPPRSEAKLRQRRRLVLILPAWPAAS